MIRDNIQKLNRNTCTLLLTAVATVRIGKSTQWNFIISLDILYLVYSRKQETEKLH
jgi:hypothetical protein